MKICNYCKHIYRFAKRVYAGSWPPLYQCPKCKEKESYLPIPNTPDTHNTQDNIDSNKYSD